MKHLFTPLSIVSHKVWVTIMAVEIILVLVLWQLAGGGLIPGPLKVLSAIQETICSPEFVFNLISSLTLTIKGMGISIVIALIISYLSVTAIAKPIAKFLVQCRYLTLTGLIFLFTLLTSNGSELKLSLLIFGIVPFFVTSQLSIISQIKQEEYDLCTTLRMTKWRTLYEVIIRGRFDQVIEVMRQNFAISWLMITMVEGLSMSEGGLGVMLIKANKYVNLPKVFALLIIIFIMGICFDIVLSKLRFWFFPYSKLKVAK